MREPVIIGDATLYCGDCREILPGLEMDAVVTSPPYDQQRQYGLQQFNWHETVCTALGKITSLEAQVLVNLGLVHRDGRVNRYWDALIGEMEDRGWRLFGWYVWDQGPGLPGDWAGRLAPSHEFIFHFNRVSRKLNKIVPCTHAGKSRGTKSGLRRVDGSIAGWSAEDLTTQDFRIGDSVVRADRHKHVGGIEAGHPAVFPVSMPRELVSSFTNAGEIVCDPFAGSGTTGVACAKLGRKFIGIEIEPKYFDIACKRIEQAYAQPDMFIQRAPEPKQESLLP